MMKKTLIYFIQISVILIFSTAINAQNKKEVLDGIFELKLGKTKEEIIVQLKDVEYEAQKENENYTKTLNYLIETGKCSFLSIEEYDVGWGIILQEVRLYFLDNKLYEIKIDKYSSELNELLVAKYGKPKKKRDDYYDYEYTPLEERLSEYDTIKSKTLSSYTINYTWKTGDRNIECKSKYTSYDERNSLNILDKTANKRYHKYYDESYKEIEKRGKEQENKKMEGMKDALEAL